MLILSPRLLRIAPWLILTNAQIQDGSATMHVIITISFLSCGSSVRLRRSCIRETTNFYVLLLTEINTAISEIWRGSLAIL
jgi:hypothetical protein